MVLLADSCNVCNPFTTPRRDSSPEHDTPTTSRRYSRVCIGCQFASASATRWRFMTYKCLHGMASPYLVTDCRDAIAGVTSRKMSRDATDKNDIWRQIFRCRRSACLERSARRITRRIANSVGVWRQTTIENSPVQYWLYA